MPHRSLASRTILWLGERECADATRVGPKAAHLSALARSHRVPAGFCITADGYRMAEESGVVPDDLRLAIAAAHERLVKDGDDTGDPVRVAVRSSALDEDGPTASFAGQHETVLNVVGVDAVIAAVERTWRSLGSEAALTYRLAHGLPVTGLALAVLVQRLVVPDASGVAFSVDPVAGRPDRIVVNAAWGLGESMVAGTVTPDSWTLDKGDLSPVAERLADKERMTVPIDGGTREVAVPRFMRTRRSLTEDEVVEVARLATSLEDELGWPVDIEFAYASRRLHLLQCRPVTTALGGERDGESAAAPVALGDLPEPWEEQGDAARYWKRDRMHFPRGLTVLDAEVARIAAEEGVNHGAQHYGFAFRNSVRRFWTYVYEADVALELAAEEREAAQARARETFETIFADFEGQWDRLWLPRIRDHHAFWFDADLEGATHGELLAHLAETMERLRDIWRLHFEILHPVFQARGSYLALHAELFESATKLDALALLQGIDSLTTSAGRHLWRLREVAVAAPAVRDVIAQRDPADVLGVLERRDDARAFLDALDGYLARFGQRSPLMALSAPTLLEDPTPVLKMLQDAIARPEHDADAHHASLVREREEAVEAKLEALGTYPAVVRDEFRRRLALAHTASRLDEDHNFLIDFASLAAARRVFLEFGRRFAAAGVVGVPDDVFHLTSDEVARTANALPRLDRRPLVAERRAEMARYAGIEPPEALGTPGPGDLAGNDFWGVPPADAPSPDVLLGNAGSSGVARGRARVVRDLDDAVHLRPGEVLVASTTSQPWMPLFATAAALVTDTGGVLSHTAVVAREYRLPAVVGTVHATARLRDGMLLEVDGDAGLVRIISETP